MFIKICFAIFSFYLMKIHFFLPRRKFKTIVLDKLIANFYLDYFKNKKNIFFLETRFFSNTQVSYSKENEIYITIYIKSIFKKIIFPKYSIKQIYILEIIKELDPENIMTFNDYNHFFLSLKKFFPKKKLIIICHTFRSATTLKSLKKILNNKKCIVDFIFMWGKKNKNYYNQICSGKYFVSGSLKNNLFPIKKATSKNKKKIIFISQYRHSNEFQKKNFYYYKNLLVKTAKYIKIKNLKLVIIGNQIEKSSKEFDWYKKILGEEKFEFKIKRKNLDSYKNSLNYQNFICFSSSLGFELASRDKRVVFFFKNQLAKNSLIYKESFIGANSGPIWTNKYSYRDIKKLLDYLIYASQKKVSIYKKKYVLPFTHYDYRLKKTKKYFEKNNLEIF